MVLPEFPDIKNSHRISKIIDRTDNSRELDNQFKRNVTILKNLNKYYEYRYYS